MAIELKQQLQMRQQLVMTPQLQQAIKLLQLSRMELIDSIREEMLENPMLIEEGMDESPAEAARSATSEEQPNAEGAPSTTDSAPAQSGASADTNANPSEAAASSRRGSRAAREPRQPMCSRSRALGPSNPTPAEGRQ